MKLWLKNEELQDTLRKETEKNKQSQKQVQANRQLVKEGFGSFSEESRLDSGAIWLYGGTPWFYQITHTGPVAGDYRRGSFYVVNGLCDNDPSDTDYEIYYYVRANVTNPEWLNAASNDIAVDAMIYYYWYQYGGMVSRGNSASNEVRVCIGDNGAATAGGPGNVTYWMLVDY